MAEPPPPLAQHALQGAPLGLLLEVMRHSRYNNAMRLEAAQQRRREIVYHTREGGPFTIFGSMASAASTSRQSAIYDERRAGDES